MDLDKDSQWYKLLWFGVSTSIILAMLYFADLSKFISSITSADPLMVGAAFFFGLLNFPLWSYVWFRFFDQMEFGIGYIKSFKLFMSGNFLNSITPLGNFGGEPLMAYIIRKNSDESYERAFSAVLSSDIMNTVPMLTFIIGGASYLVLFESLNNFVANIFYISILISVVGGSIVYNLWFNAGKIESKILKIIKIFLKPFDRGENLVKSAEKRLNRVQESFDSIGKNPKHLLVTSIAAHLGFLTQVFCLYFILLSLGFETDFTPLYFVVTLSGFANFSPTPGGSGTFEAAMAGLLTFFVTIDFATAVTTAIIYRLTTYWPGILLGYIAFNHIEYNREK